MAISISWVVYIYIFMIYSVHYMWCPRPKTIQMSRPLKIELMMIKKTMMMLMMLVMMLLTMMTTMVKIGYSSWQYQFMSNPIAPQLIRVCVCCTCMYLYVPVTTCRYMYVLCILCVHYLCIIGNDARCPHWTAQSCATFQWPPAK